MAKHFVEMSLDRFYADGWPAAAPCRNCGKPVAYPALQTEPSILSGFIHIWGDCIECRKLDPPSPSREE